MASRVRLSPESARLSRPTAHVSCVNTVLSGVKTPAGGAAENCGRFPPSTARRPPEARRVRSPPSCGDDQSVDIGENCEPAVRVPAGRSRGGPPHRVHPVARFVPRRRTDCLSPVRRRRTTSARTTSASTAGRAAGRYDERRIAAISQARSGSSHLPSAASSEAPARRVRGRAARRERNDGSAPYCGILQLAVMRSLIVRDSGRSANSGHTSGPQAREPSPCWAASTIR